MVDQDPVLGAEMNQLPVTVKSVDDAGTLKKKVTVEIAEETINGKMAENFTEVAESAAIPGFRVGRAPRRLIEKRFTKDVRDQVRMTVIAQGVDAAIKSADLKVLGDPDIDLEKITLPESGAMTFSFEVEVEPSFELPSLDGIAVNENPKEVTEADIDEQVDNIRWRLANLEEAAAGSAVEKNDHVAASVTLQVGDEPPVVRHDLELAARGQAIEGVMFEKLDEVLIGTKVGDSKTTEAVVSNEHATESWRGKTAKATIEITKVSKWILPEVSDALTQQFGVESVEKWREAIKGELEGRKGQQVRRDMEDQVREYLLGQVKFDLPEKMTERQTDRALIRRIFQLQQMGMPQVLIEEKIDELRSRSREAAVKDLKLSFIMEKIARQMEIEVSDEEVNSMIANVALSQGRRPERVRQEMLRDGRYENAFGVVREQKVLEKLLSTAKITKSSGEKADSKKKK